MTEFDEDDDAAEMRELDATAVADVIERVCASETFADVTPVWDKRLPEVRAVKGAQTGFTGNHQIDLRQKQLITIINWWYLVVIGHSSCTS